MIIKFFDVLCTITFFMGIVAFVLGQPDKATILFILTMVIENRMSIEKIKKGDK